MPVLRKWIALTLAVALAAALPVGASATDDYWSGPEEYYPHVDPGEVQFPPVPEVRYAVYHRVGSVLDADAFAQALWDGKPYWHRTIGDMQVYGIEARDNPWISLPATMVMKEGELQYQVEGNIFEATYDMVDPSDCTAWMEKMFASDALAPYVALYAGWTYEDDWYTSCYVHYQQEAEGGIGLFGSGITARVCSEGPWTMSVRWDKYHPDAGVPVPEYLSAREAVERYNQVCDDYSIRVDRHITWAILDIRPVYSDQFGPEGTYRLCWQLQVDDGFDHEFVWFALVDAETGKVWEDWRDLYAEKRKPVSTGPYFLFHTVATPVPDYGEYALSPASIDAEAVARALWGDAGWTAESKNGLETYSISPQFNPCGPYGASLTYDPGECLLHYRALDLNDALNGESDYYYWPDVLESWFGSRGLLDMFGLSELDNAWSEDIYANGGPWNTDSQWEKRIIYLEPEVECGILADGFGLAVELRENGPVEFTVRLAEYTPLEGINPGPYLSAREACDLLNQYAMQYEGWEDIRVSGDDWMPVYTTLFSPETYRLAWRLDTFYDVLYVDASTGSIYDKNGP